MKFSLKIIVVGFFIACIILVIYIFKQQKPEKDPLRNVSWLEVTPPSSFKTEEAKNLNKKAFDLKKNGQIDQAIKVYRQALDVEPDNTKMLFDIAECYARTNRFNDAILTLNRAINLDSSYPGYYNNRGLYYYQIYEDEKAIADFTKAIQLDNMNSSIYYNLSISYYSAKRFEDACKAFNKANNLGLDINPIRDQKEYKLLQKLCN